MATELQHLMLGSIYQFVGDMLLFHWLFHCLMHRLSLKLNFKI